MREMIIRVAVALVGLVFFGVGIGTLFLVDYQLGWPAGPLCLGRETAPSVMA